MPKALPPGRPKTCLEVPWSPVTNQDTGGTQSAANSHGRALIVVPTDASLTALCIAAGLDSQQHIL